MKRIALLALALSCASLPAADFYPELQVGTERYENVHVLSSNASSLSIRHARGIAQVPLSQLSEELQLKYGYSSEAALAREAELEKLRAQQVQEGKVRLAKRIETAAVQAKTRSAPKGLDGAFSSFGEAPELRRELDLRPTFRSHGIGVRRQRGASCAVHAIVAALEFQYAVKSGKQVDLSENHLVGATCKTLGRKPRNIVGSHDQNIPVVEEGFTLEQVFQAIRGFGLRPEASSDSAEAKGSNDSLQDVNFGSFQVPGSPGPIAIGNIVHVLNAGMPVVIGIGWPADWRIRNTNTLSAQPPLSGAGHAVTLVGYRCETGRLEDTRFIFRNSWGTSWGAGGYGFVTYKYLAENLFSSYVVELR